MHSAPFGQSTRVRHGIAQNPPGKSGRHTLPAGPHGENASHGAPTLSSAKDGAAPESSSEPQAIRKKSEAPYRADRALDRMDDTGQPVKDVKGAAEMPHLRQNLKHTVEVPAGMCARFTGRTSRSGTARRGHHSERLPPGRHVTSSKLRRPAHSAYPLDVCSLLRRLLSNPESGPAVRRPARG